jgi:Domain of unknown function (DUF4861)
MSLGQRWCGGGLAGNQRSEIRGDMSCLPDATLRRQNTLLEKGLRTAGRGTQRKGYGMKNFSGGARCSHRYEWLALLAMVFLASLVSAAPPSRQEQIVLKVNNPTTIARQEVIAIRLKDVLKRFPTSNPNKIRVQTSPGNEELPTQIFNSVVGAPADQLLVFVSIAAEQTIQLKFFLSDSATLRKPLVFGRAVPERKDDFAWENDKVAYRVYGPALQATGEISSGIDVWSKRVSDLIINDWYAKDVEGQRTKNPALTYHKDSGQGLDSYDVGLTRGCGGTAIESGGKFFVSKNYTNAEVLANGPIRFQFRLHYAAWPAGGVHVSEEKIITLDAGTHMNRIQSTFSFEGVTTVHAGIGLATHARAETSENPEAGILSVWESLADSSAGMDGTGIVLPAGVTATVTRADGNIYFVLDAKRDVSIVYYAGAGWSKSDISDQAAWQKYLHDFSMDLQRPLHMSWAQ